MVWMLDDFAQHDDMIWRRQSPRAGTMDRMSNEESAQSTYAGKSALIIVESQFGNTRRIANAIAEGYGDGAQVVAAVDASATIPTGVDLLVVGAPTHAFHLPSPDSRKDAAKQGAEHVAQSGLVEWIARVEPRAALHTVAFDTVVHTPRIVTAIGTAARHAAKLLRRRGFDVAHETVSFVVAGKPPELVDGEEQRARNFGRQLAGGSQVTCEPDIAVTGVKLDN